MVIKPLHKLPKKLTPVRTIIMTMMRPCFKLPSSRSRGTRDELPESDLVSSVAREPAGTGPGTEMEFLGGIGDNSFLFVGTNSIADKNSDMMNLRSRVTYNRSKILRRLNVCGFEPLLIS
jgi:hypothetical protein